MLRLTSPVLSIAYMQLISSENRAYHENVNLNPKQTRYFLKNKLRIVRNVLFSIFCLLSSLCQGNDKECKKQNDSLKVDIYKQKPLKVRQELYAQKSYVDSLFAHQERVYFQDNRVENNTYICTGQTDTNTVHNKNLLPFAKKSWFEKLIDKFAWFEKFIKLLAPIFNFLFKKQWKRKYKKSIYFRWFRRKVLRFYNFLL